MVCFLNVIAQIAVPEASDVAMNCYHSGNVLWVLQWVLMLAIPLLFLVTEWSGRWSVFAKKYGVNWFGHFLIYLIGFVAFYLLSLWGQFLIAKKPDKQLSVSKSLKGIPLRIL